MQAGNKMQKEEEAHRDSIHRVIHLEHMEYKEGAGEGDQTPDDTPQGRCPWLECGTPRSDDLHMSCM